MKTKKRIAAKMLTTLLAWILLAGGFGVAGVQVHAAGEAISGPHSITVNYEPKDGETPVTLTDDTVFSLFRVGDFGRDDSGKVTFVVDSKFGDITVENYDKDDFETEEAWTEAWMNSAKAVANRAAELELEADRTATMVAGQKTITFSSLPNGLYLVTGTATEVKEGPKSTWWYPQPMFVMILNGDKEIFTKPVASVVNRFTVHKAWSGDEEVADLVRPDGVNIKIFYGTIDDNELKYEETLNKENNWTFEWETEGETDPTRWFVTEELTAEDKKNYSWNIEENTQGETEDGNRILLTLTNTYDRKELEIVKTMKDYVDHSKKSNSTVVFELNGYMKDESGAESVVYHKYVSLVYDLNTESEQKLPVKDIPAGLSKLVVKEVYSGNTRPDPAGETEKEAVLDTAGKKYSVDFTDVYDDIIYSSGVINKYQIKKDGDDYGYKFIGKEPEAVQDNGQ